MLEARAIHTGRSAYNHLLAMAQTHGIPRSAGRRGDRARRAGERRAQARRRLLARHGPAPGHRRGAARRPARSLILDEPANGLDPEGILWIRNLLKGLAAEGRTVFLSSHLMSEIALTAEHLVVIGRGRLIADTIGRRVRRAGLDRRRGPRAHARRRRAARRRSPGRASRPSARARRARGPRPERPRRSARSRRAHGIALYELTPQQASLEDAFMRLTGDSVDYHASADAAVEGRRA